MFNACLLSFGAARWSRSLRTTVPLGVLAVASPLFVALIQDPSEVAVGIWMVAIIFTWFIGLAIARQERLGAELEGIITGAALIIVAVFSGFARGDLIMFQQMGFGVGVALNATVIRSVLLPSVMKLLGEWNWYLPRWLEWQQGSRRRIRTSGYQAALACCIPSTPV